MKLQAAHRSSGSYFKAVKNIGKPRRTSARKPSDKDGDVISVEVILSMDAMGCSRKALGQWDGASAPVDFLANGHFLRMPCQLLMSVNGKGDNEMNLVAMHRFYEIYFKAEGTLGKPQLEDRLKTAVPIVLTSTLPPNGVGRIAQKDSKI